MRDLPSATTLFADVTRRGRVTSRGGRFGRTPSRALSVDGRYAVFSSNGTDLDGRIRHHAIFRRDLARGRAGRACAWLGRGGRLRRGPCGRPQWLRARLTSGLRFTLRVGRLLPRGVWTVRSRAQDAGGQVETPRPGENIVTVRLR